MKPYNLGLKPEPDDEGLYTETQVQQLREHEASADCWCRPTPDEEHDVFVHHSLDGREAYETGEKRPS